MLDAVRDASQLALIQYTSGSTGSPKGVALSHANILANIRAFGEHFAIVPDDEAVTWLPLYHDMGLIGTWFGSLYYGIPLAVMSASAYQGAHIRKEYSATGVESEMSALNRTDDGGEVGNIKKEYLARAFQPVRAASGQSRQPLPSSRSRI